MHGITMAVLILTGLVLVAQAIQVLVYRTFTPTGFSGQGDVDFDNIPALLTFLAVVIVGGILGWAQIIVAVVWMYKASANVTAAGIRDRTWGPGWAIGAWFIPIANMVLGFLVIREIWRGSQPGVTDATWRSGGLPAWIVAWWVFYATSYVVSYASAGFVLVETMSAAIADPFADVSQPDVFIATAVAAACYMISGLFFMHFVRVVQGLQDNTGTGLPTLPQAL